MSKQLSNQDSFLILLDFQFMEQIDGVYHGFVDRAYKKQGKGIFISDDSIAYIGDWQQDTFHGQGLMLFPFGGYLFADFKKNQLQGPAVLRMSQSKIIVGHFVNSMLHGICFNFNLISRIWTMSEYNNGIVAKIIHEEKGDSQKIPQIMQNYVELYYKFQRVLDKDFIQANSNIVVQTLENGYLFVITLS